MLWAGVLMLWAEPMLWAGLPTRTRARPKVSLFHTLPMSSRLSILCLTLSTLLSVGCGGGTEEETPTMRTRPVSVLELQEQDFARESHLTGSVSLYREEKVGFEVDGRILAVLDVGKEVQGPAFREDGTLHRQGELIASLDDTRYQLQVKALAARLKSSEKQLSAQKIDVEQVAKNDVEAARRDVDAAGAALKLAEQTLDRQKKLLEEGAGLQQAVDDAQSAYDTLFARKAQSESALLTAEGAVALKEARVEATAAQIDELTQDLERAKEDLADCILVAPFTGRITEVHVSQGAVVEVGKPVVTLSLLDPIQVRVAVSADEDRMIRTGDRALLYPRDPIDPAGKPVEVYALVYEKGAVADPVTRTFRLDLMARNQRRLIEDIDPETKGLPVVEDYLPVVRQYQGEGGPFFVNTDCIYRQDGKSYVLRLPGVSFNPAGVKSAVGKHAPDLVEVTLGDEYFTVNKWNFRSLQASGDLQEGDFLVKEPKKEHLDGLACGRPQWLLRPGDLVPVQFFLQRTPKGFYVPVSAITMRGSEHSVYVVTDDKAQLTPVTVHETYGELRRIEGAGVQSGARVIVSGVHYVSDGQPVSIVGQESLQP